MNWIRKAIRFSGWSKDHYNCLYFDDYDFAMLYHQALFNKIALKLKKGTFLITGKRPFGEQGYKWLSKIN